MTPGPALLAAALILVASLAAGPAPAQTAECAAPTPDCAAELPAGCLQRLGAGAMASDPDCAGKFDAYLACLDRIIACAPEPEPVAVRACSEERETALWRETRDSRDAADFDFFLEVCPDSVFRRFAESKRTTLANGAGQTGARASALAELTTLRDRRARIADEAAVLAPQITVLTPQLDALRAQLEMARRNFERLKQLVERGVAMRNQYDEAERDALELDARYRSLRAQLQDLRDRRSQTEAEMTRLDGDIAQTERETQ